jgi:hypothetical protein
MGNESKSPRGEKRAFAVVARAWLVAVAAPMLAGCAAPRGLGEHYTLSISPRFTAEQTDSIIAGATEWSRATVGLTFEFVVSECMHGVLGESVCIHPSDRRACNNEYASGCATGHPGDGIAIITAEIAAQAADDVEGKAVFHHTAMHELGHAMGLAHSKPGTLMNGDYWTAADHVTSDDVAQFWTLRR